MLEWVSTLSCKSVCQNPCNLPVAQGKLEHHWLRALEHKTSDILLFYIIEKHVAILLNNRTPHFSIVWKNFYFFLSVKQTLLHFYTSICSKKYFIAVEWQHNNQFKILTFFRFPKRMALGWFNQLIWTIHNWLTQTIFSNSAQVKNRKINQR